MINFINTFLSQIVLMVVIVVVAGAGTAAGIAWAKKKNADTASLSPEGDNGK